MFQKIAFITIIGFIFVEINAQHEHHETEHHHEVEHEHATSHQMLHIHHFHPVKVFVKHDKHPHEIGNTEQKLKVLHPETEHHHNHGFVLEDHHDTHLHHYGGHDEHEEEHY